MGVEAEVGVFLGEEGLSVEIKGDHDAVLIGKAGHTMEALQTVISRMVNRNREARVKVIVDVDGYRKKKEESIESVARQAWEEARVKGEVVTIGPFNAYERRIVHLLFEGNPFVMTESVGEGLVKKVRIIPTKKEG